MPEVGPRLAGAVALVTGAAGGIGSAIVQRLAEEGARVVATDLEPPTFDGESSVDRVLPLAHDVRSEWGWEGVVATTEEEFGPISVLVNNAGILHAGPDLTELSEDDYRRVLDVNQVGVFLGMKSVAKSMRRGGRGGSIVNISSVGGMRGLGGMLSYVATKWAVRGMTKAAAIELGPDGIRVNSVHPGRIATPMTEGLETPASIPVGRTGSPAEVASLVAFLASADSSYCSGSEHVVDGGQTAGDMRYLLTGRP